MNRTISKLKKVLEKVSDSYPDFVTGSLRVVDNNPEKAEMLLAFIEKYPNAGTSEITRFETEHILGIKPLS